MERLNKSQDKNVETGWEDSGGELRSQILAEILEVQRKIDAVDKEKEENLAIMKRAEILDDPHAQGIFEERFEYEMRRLDMVSYDLEVKLNGLKYQLSNLENKD